MRSTSRCPDRRRTLRAAVAAACLVAAPAHAQTFPVFAGDPVDTTTGAPFPILPGVPLILPQPGSGKFNPPIVVAGTIGDVDLVVRAGSPAVGATMPPPSAPPPTAVAGGTHVVDGSEIPFTVIVSDGSGGAGAPLVGPEMDGLPVIVFAFADLDGDGIVGPTNADPDGAADDARERQESDFVVGRTAAILANGVARGSVAVWRGAPASSGGLKVVLTAAAYVGPFSAGFMLGNVPDGPPIATLLPFFPRFDPKDVVESAGRGGPAGPEARLGVALEAAFDPPVDDPELGTPFALPTDGSSVTIDRAVVVSGPPSRARFVQPSIAAGFPLGLPVELHPGANGTLVEPLDSVTLPDDGPGPTTHARLVPVDLFDDVADPPPGFTVVLTAGAGLRIVAPDTDGDPTVETLPIASAAGVDIELDDAGGARDGPASSSLTVSLGGLPVESLAVTLVPGAGTSTTTTTLGASPSTTTTTTAGGSTTTLSGAGVPPVIALAIVVGGAATLSVGCPATRTLVAVVADPDGDVAAASATVASAGTVVLSPGTAPAGVTVPPGAVFTGTLALSPAAAGSVAVTFAAADAAGHTAEPVGVSLPVADHVAPLVGAPAIVPSTIPAGARTTVSITAHVADDCGAKRVQVEMDRGKGFRRIARMRDDGKHGDAVAGDGVYTATKRLKLRAGGYALRVTARSRSRADGSGAPATLQVGP